MSIQELLATIQTAQPLRTGRDEYALVTPSRVPPLQSCPMCASVAEMWRYQPNGHDASLLAVMCSNSEDFDADIDSGCPLHLVPISFYAATIREAAAYWNGYAMWIVAQRKARGAG